MQVGERLRKVARVTTYVPIKPSVTEVKRSDRKNTEFRPIYLKTGVISQASGSAYIELNKTKLICGIYGPRQTNEFSDKGKLQVDIKYASFSCEGERKKFIADKEEQELSMLVVQALEVSVLLDKFPKSVIDIFIIVLESDGGVLNAAITCSSLALADAGIECYDLVASTSVAFTKTSDLLLDPVKNEEEICKSKLTVSYMPSVNEITQVFQQGETEISLAQQAIDLAIDAAAKIYLLMRNALIISQK